MNVRVKISQCSDSSYAAWCPALPGCAVRAETRAEARGRIQDAVAGYLASLDVALPRELGRMFRVKAPAAAERPIPGGYVGR